MYNIRKINFTDIDTFRGHVFLVFLAHALTVCAINYSEPSSQLARAHTIQYNALHCKAKMRNKTDDSQRKSQKKLKQPHDNTGFCWLFFASLLILSACTSFFLSVLFCYAPQYIHVVSANWWPINSVFVFINKKKKTIQPNSGLSTEHF